MDKVLNVLILLISCLVYTSCSIQNKFNPPKALTESTDIKRLIIFKGSVVDRNDNTKVWGPNCRMICVPSGNRRNADLGRNINSGYTTYIFEFNKADTGSMTFIMSLIKAFTFKRISTDTTMNFTDFHIGNNYWHLNYYIKFETQLGWVPSIELNGVDIEKDFFTALRKIKFKHVLTYNLDTDSVIYQRRKAIVSNPAK